MSDKKQYLRFSLIRRVEHWLNVTAFTLLALTGLSQKFGTSALAVAIIRTLGGVERIRIVHRVSAVTLALVVIFHVGAAVYHLYVKAGRPTMLPTIQDILNGWQAIKYNLGFSDERPLQDFYTFEEKVEYWALVWGMVIMGITGFFLWNPITAARILPGQFIPAAKAAHGNEALLAVLAIVLWHFYHVLIRHFNTSMYTGYMSLEEMEQEHPLALQDNWKAPEASDLQFQKRRKRFWIGYSLVALVTLLGIWWFVTSEATAYAAVEPIPDLRGIELYNTPQPTPLPTPLPTPEKVRVLGTTWDDGVGEFLSNRCGDCHSSADSPGGLDLTSYNGAVRGGNSGPAVVPYGPGVSLIMVWPEFDWHLVKFSPGERTAIWTWIQNGAPEQ